MNIVKIEINQVTFRGVVSWQADITAENGDIYSRVSSTLRGLMEDIIDEFQLRWHS